MHSIHGYIIGIIAIYNTLAIYHVKSTATHWFYTNTILYIHADILTLIYATTYGTYLFWGCSPTLFATYAL